jgi:hypothetical protein
MSMKVLKEVQALFVIKFTHIRAELGVRKWLWDGRSEGFLVDST